MNDDQVLQPILPPFNEVIGLPGQFIANNKWLEAAKCWSILRNAYPEQPAPWLQGAFAEIKIGELKQAEHLLSYALKQFTTNPLTYIVSAELAIQKKQWARAIYLLQHARKQFPSHVQVWNKSSELAKLQGNFDRALEFNAEARRRFPDNPECFIQYAELAMSEKNWEEGLKRWEELRSRFPDIPAGYLRAAEAARELGRPQAARHLILSHQYGEIPFAESTAIQSVPERKLKKAVHGRLLGLIWTKAIFNLRSEVHRNYLSYGWWVLEPLLHMVVYYVVFGILLDRGNENYPVFLLTGLIPWMWFMKAVSGSSNSIIAGQNLMLQVGLPSVVFPLISLLQSTLKQLPVFVLLVGFVWLVGYNPASHWWALIPVIIVQALLTIAFTCAVAAVIPFARDLSYLVPTGLTFLMFLSGIFYDYRMISIEWQGAFLLNPMAFLLKCYRDIFIDGSLPDFKILTWWGLGSAMACLLLLLAYQRLRYIYPRVVME